MKISTTRIATLLLLTLFAFMNIHCGGGKTIDPNAPRELMEIKAEGESSTKQTDDEPGKIMVEAKCTEDYPILFQCKKWWAETGTAGDDPFKSKGLDGAIQRKPKIPAYAKDAMPKNPKIFLASPTIISSAA